MSDIIWGKCAPKTPILGAWIRIFKPNSPNQKHAYYRNYCINFNQILHNDKDHKMLCGWSKLNPRKTNPRWRTAAILKNQKSRYLSILTKFCMVKQLDLCTELTNKISRFLKSKMVDGRHLEYRKPRYLGNGMADFNEIWHAVAPNPLHPVSQKISRFLKSKMADGRHLEYRKAAISW